MGWKSTALKLGGIGAMFIPGVGPAIGTGLLAAGSAMDAKEATKEATDVQTAAVDKSLALTERMYDQTRADLGPYRETGYSAIGTLGALMGLPSGGGGGAAPPAEDPNAPPIARSTRRPFTGEPVGHAQPRTGPLPERPLAIGRGRMADAQVMADRAQTQSASSVGGDARVRIATPNGRVVMVPAEQVEEAISRGGRVM